MICPQPAVLNSAAMLAPTPQPHHKRQSRAAGSCFGPKAVFLCRKFGMKLHLSGTLCRIARNMGDEIEVRYHRACLGSSSIASQHPAFDPVNDRGHPEKVEHDIDIEVGNVFPPGPAAVIRDIGRFVGKPERVKLLRSQQ